MSWQNHLASTEDLDDGDPRKWQLVDQFAQAVGAQFLQGHQVVHNKVAAIIEARPEIVLQVAESLGWRVEPPA